MCGLHLEYLTAIIKGNAMKNEEKLHTLRKQKGITQAELAEIMDVSRQAVSRWESGVVTPSIENLKRLSSLYGVPLDYLLNEETEKEDGSSQSQNLETSVPDAGLGIHSREDTSFENGDKKKRKRLVIGLLLGIATMLVILGIVVAVIELQNGGLNYNEMKSDSLWSSSSKNGEFDLQW